MDQGHLQITTWRTFTNLLWIHFHTHNTDMRRNLEEWHVLHNTKLYIGRNPLLSIALQLPLPVVCV